MSFRIATAFVDVRADDSGLREDVAAKVRAAADGQTAAVRVNADSAGLAEEVRAAADAAHGEAHVKIKVDESAGGVGAGLAALGSEAMPEADRIGSEIGKALGGGLTRDANGYLRNASGLFASEAEKAAAGIKNTGQAAQSSQSSFKGLSVSASGTATALKIVGGISLAPTIGAIPGIAAAAAGGLATLALGLADVAKVLHEAGQASGAMGQSGAQMALTAYTDSVAVRGAKQTIADAERNASQQAVDSAEQITGAERSVADAVRSAANQQISSSEQVASAKQSLTDVQRQASISQQNSLDSIASASLRLTTAQRSEQQALRDLTLAQQDAVNTVTDLNNANKSAALQAQGADLALKQAIRNNEATQSNSLATDDMKAASTLAVAEAQQGVAEAQQRSKEATLAADRANAEGAAKLPAVVSAQQKLADTVQSVADAQHAVDIANRDADNQRISSIEQAAGAEQRLQDAVRSQADQQISSAEQIANAEKGLADARRSADRQTVTSAEQVANAKQALVDLEKEQALSAAAAAASGSSAANQFAKDYAKLTPAAKAFVDQVLSMRSEMHLLSNDAQSAMLPGFTQMLKDSQHLLPAMELGVKSTGHALSDMAVSFGHLFANPQFDASAMQFTQLVTAGFGQFVSALPPLLNSIVTEGVRAAPLINAVAVGVHDLIATGLPAFLSGLNVNASGAAVGVGALFHGVSALLGPVGTLVGSLAGALGPAIAVLVPGVVQFADKIEQSLLPMMPQLSTDLLDVANVINELFTVLAPVIPLITGELTTGLQIVDPLLKDTAQFLHDNATWLTPVAEGILGVYAAWKLYQGVSSLATAATGKVTSALSSFSGKAKAAGKDAEAAGESVGGASGLAGKLGRSLPAIGAAVAAGGLLINWLDKVVDGGQHAASSVDQYSLALLNTKSASLGAAGSGEAFTKMTEGLGGHLPSGTTQISAMGTAMALLDQKMHNGGDALKNYDGGLANLVSTGHADQAKSTIDEIAAATNSHGKALINTAKEFPQYFAALDHQAVEQQTATTKTDDTKTALSNLGTQLDTTKDKFQSMSGVMSQTEALDRFHAQLLNLKDAADQNGVSLDGNTVKGLANRAAFSGLADQIQAYGQQLRDSGEPAGVAAAHMQDMIGDLEKQGAGFGYNKDQVDAYIKKLGLIPSSISTTLNTTIAIKLDQAALQAAADDIGHTVAHHIIPGQAVGGPVIGPGTGTSDSVLRRLSNGEFVVPAASAAQIGPAGMEQIRHGQIPRVGGTTAQPAAPVINLNYYGTQQPTPEQQQVMMRDLALTVRS